MLKWFPKGKHLGNSKFVTLHNHIKFQKMKELELEQMENIEGGNCGLAIAVGAIGAAAIIGTAIWAPYIWASPKTWYAASFLITGNAYNIYSSCS